MDNTIFKNTLKMVSSMITETKEKGITIPKEMSALYGIAFSDLLFSGESFTLKTPEAVGVKRASGVAGLLFNGDTEYDDPNTYIIIKTDKDTFKITDKELEPYMRGRYREIVLGEKDDEGVQTGAEKKELDSFVCDFGDDEPVKEEVKPQAVAAPVEETESDNTHMASFEAFSNCKDDPYGEKSFDSFFFDLHTTDVLDQTGKRDTLNVYVYPLNNGTTDSLSADILVVAVLGNAIRTGISRGNTCSVTLSYGDLRFIARGTWHNGVFNSTVSFLNTEVDKVVFKKVTHERTLETSTGYIRTDVGGRTVYMFPGEFNENSLNGFALFAAAVVEGNEVRCYAPNNTGALFVTGVDKKQYKIVCYSMGDKTMYYDITEA